MSDFLPFIVAGIISGSLYGLAATGLVLTFKTSGIFNFAHGAVAAAGAYCFYELHTVRGLPWPAALLISCLVFAPLMGAGIEFIARHLREAGAASRIVATVGLLLAILGALEVLYGQTPLPFPPFFPTGSFEVFDVRISHDQVIVLLISLACVGGLQVFFRTSRLGLQIRGVVDDQELIALVGSRPAVVQRFAWAIGTSFATLSGILLATFVGLNPIILALLTVQAFGAAAVGRFRNLGITFAGAIALGITAEVIKRYVPGNPTLAGLPTSLPFIVLFGVLVLARPGQFTSVEGRPRPSTPYRPPPMARRALSVIGIVTVLALPSLVGTRLVVYTNGAIYVLLLVSLALLVRLSGYVSLCTLSFAAVGATTFSHLTEGLGLPWLLAAGLAGAVVVPIGGLLALPAVRLPPLFLGLATFGFGILVEQFFFKTALMFGSADIRSAARPAVLGLEGDRGFFYLCASFAVLSIVLAVGVSGGRLGRLLHGLGDSTVALSTHGADVNITRVLVFCISAFLAGLGGVLLISLTGSARGSGTVFAFLGSLTLLAVLVISGRSLVAGPVIGAFLLTVLPSYITNPDLGSYQLIGFGVAAILVVTAGPALGSYLDRAGPASAWRRERSPVRARRLAPVDGSVAKA